MTQQQLIDLVVKAFDSKIESFYPALIGIQFLVVLVAAVVGTLFGAWFSGYGKKKGENLATKEDHHELLRQIKINTSTVEEIKFDLAASDWMTKEWKTLRRQKLEEMIATMISLCDHQKSLQDSLIFEHGERPANVDIFPRITMLCEIYFPECKVTYCKFRLAARNLESAIHSTKLELLKNTNNSSVCVKLRQDFCQKSIEYSMDRDAAMVEMIEDVGVLIRGAYQPPIKDQTTF